MQKISVQGMRLVDEQGREHILRGVNLKCDENVEKKITPLDKLGWLDEEFFRHSKALGFRLLRLGIQWSYYEPEPGQYDEAILQEVDRIFDMAARTGMYIFFDMHQDLYAAFEDGVGNGAPAWACLTNGYKRGKTRKVWAEGYFWDKAVHACFENFWNNATVPATSKGLQDHYAELWQMLARRYGDSPALFGFDLMNEPHPGKLGGEIFRALVKKGLRVFAVSPTVKRIRFLKALLKKDGYMLDHAMNEASMRKITGAKATKLTREFETKLYAPFVARMSKAIREITPNGLIIVEQNYFANLGIVPSFVLPEGEQVLYTPHAYDFTVDTPAYEFASSERAGFMYDQYRIAQEHQGIPALVGEWGGGGEGESFFPHIKFLMDKFDSYNWGNTYFTYQDGFYDKPIIRVISRPFPMAVNGVLKCFHVMEEKNIFLMKYEPSGHDLYTEIYLPKGYESVDAGEGAEILLEGNVLKIKTKASKIVVKYIDREIVQEKEQVSV